jgi:hypothetical protein
MTLDFDTFLVALYTSVDDLYRQRFARHKPSRRGRKPRVSDSEVLTLALLAHWLRRSERGLCRRVARDWHAYFPQPLSQSAFNRRVRDLAGVLVAMVPLLSQLLAADLSPYQILDGTPVPLMSRRRGTRHRLFADTAGIGRGGSDREWYYGCQLLLAISAEGAITGFVLGPANTEIHWLGDALLCWRANPLGQPWTAQDPPPSHRAGGGYVGPTGPLWPPDGVGGQSTVPYIADGGFRGQSWRAHWRGDYQALLFTPEVYQGPEARAARRQHSHWRQLIETVNDILKWDFALGLPGGRTRQGLRARIAAKLAGYNLGLLLARQFGIQGLVHATLFS